MGNCMEKKNVVPLVADEARPQGNEGQFRINLKRQQEIAERDLKTDFLDHFPEDPQPEYGPKSLTIPQPASGLLIRPIGDGKKAGRINFDNIGSNFMFLEEAKRLFDENPWQRDEGDSSNRPNTLQFGLQRMRQPPANGLATRMEGERMVTGGHQQSLNMSMNRTGDKGYSQTVLNFNRKKQNIFYDASTYNQNPYVKSTVNSAPPTKFQKSTNRSMNAQFY